LEIRGEERNEEIKTSVTASSMRVAQTEPEAVWQLADSTIMLQAHDHSLVLHSYLCSFSQVFEQNR